MNKAASLFRSIMKWFENCTLGPRTLSGQDGLVPFCPLFLFWGSCIRTECGGNDLIEVSGFENRVHQIFALPGQWRCDVHCQAEEVWPVTLRWKVIDYPLARICPVAGRFCVFILLDNGYCSLWKRCLSKRDLQLCDREQSIPADVLLL